MVRPALWSPVELQTGGGPTGGVWHAGRVVKLGAPGAFTVYAPSAGGFIESAAIARRQLPLRLAHPFVGAPAEIRFLPDGRFLACTVESLLQPPPAILLLVQRTGELLDSRNFPVLRVELRFVEDPSIFSVPGPRAPPHTPQLPLGPSPLPDMPVRHEQKQTAVAQLPEPVYLEKRIAQDRTKPPRKREHVLQKREFCAAPVKKMKHAPPSSGGWLITRSRALAEKKKRTRGHQKRGQVAVEEKPKREAELDEHFARENDGTEEASLDSADEQDESPAGEKDNISAGDREAKPAREKQDGPAALKSEAALESVAKPELDEFVEEELLAGFCGMKPGDSDAPPADDPQAPSQQEQQSKSTENSIDAPSASSSSPASAAAGCPGAPEAQRGRAPAAALLPGKTPTPGALSTPAAMAADEGTSQRSGPAGVVPAATMTPRRGLRRRRKPLALRDAGDVAVGAPASGGAQMVATRVAGGTLDLGISPVAVAHASGARAALVKWIMRLGGGVARAHGVLLLLKVGRSVADASTLNFCGARADADAAATRFAAAFARVHAMASAYDPPSAARADGARPARNSYALGLVDAALLQIEARAARRARAPSATLHSERVSGAQPPLLTDGAGIGTSAVDPSCIEIRKTRGVFRQKFVGDAHSDGTRDAAGVDFAAPFGSVKKGISGDAGGFS